MSNADKNASSHAASPVRHTAGWADVRAFIGGLMAIYGVVLLLTGLFDDTGRTSGGQAIDVNINLWVGIGLLIFAAGMLAWTKARPTIVDEAQLAQDKEQGSGHH